MAKDPKASGARKRRMRPENLRSRTWFDNPDNPDMTALYLERYMNYGLTREELSSGKPIIGIAQSGSDLSPCNRPQAQDHLRARRRSLAASVALQTRNVDSDDREETPHAQR